MREAIRRAVKGLFPELGAGLHLDRYARVLAVADAPGQGAASERFRPRYAVDIQILTADGEPDPAFPTYTAVPLPVPTGAGQEKGFFSFPEPGAQVVVGFAYGRPDHPIIRQTYPLGVSLPEVAQGEQLWQSTPAVYQRADAGGNWTRATEAKIEDASRERVVRAQTSADELGTETRTIREHSKESVGGIKQIEATTLSLVGGLRADLGSLGNVNVTAGAHMTITTGQGAHGYHGRRLRRGRGREPHGEGCGQRRGRSSRRKEPEDRRRRNHNRLRSEHGEGRRRENGHGGANDLQFRVDHRLQRGRRGRRRDVRFQ